MSTAPSISADLLTMQQAADRIGVSKSQVSRYVSAGRLPSVAVGNSRLIPVEAVDQFDRRPRGNPAFVKKN